MPRGLSSLPQVLPCVSSLACVVSRVESPLCHLLALGLEQITYLLESPFPLLVVPPVQSM